MTLSTLLRPFKSSVPQVAPSINYMPVFYLGKRRSGQPACQVEEHLDYLQKHRCPVDKVTLILNADKSSQVVEFSKLVGKYKPYYTDLKVIVRENQGFSYGGWHSGVNSSLAAGESYDYFLIEDDYIPNSPDFLDIFYSKLDDKTSYVCLKVLDTNGQPHPAHSIGLLNGAAARKAYSVGASPVLYEPSPWGYAAGEYNQVHFLDDLNRLGYGITDIADRYSVPFESIDKSIRELGVPGALAPIVPVGYNG